MTIKQLLLEQGLISSGLSLYEVSELSKQQLRVVIASTDQSRRICNDPLCYGVEYTNALRECCALALKGLENAGLFNCQEHSTTVLNILRGGLNFGLRDALSTAFGWNHHTATFISAQRRRRTEDPSSWEIIEDGYRKFPASSVEHVVFGDVVATGTSLEHALDEIAGAWGGAGKTLSNIKSITFFTIGGFKSYEKLKNLLGKLSVNKAAPIQATVVYLEGVFGCPDSSSPLRIKLQGTDLVRRDAIMAPEFVASQYQDPAYPLERCTIYDAGSRSFDWSEYAGDVHDYWSQVKILAQEGVSFKELLAERFPGLDSKLFGTVNLEEICNRRLDRFPAFNNQGLHSV